MAQCPSYFQMIWDEVGQETERERILEELEQECQEVYRRKVSANMSRIQLHQALAEPEAEFTIFYSLGERSFPGRVTSMSQTYHHTTILNKKQFEANLLNAITPALQEMQMRKEARVKQFTEAIKH
ncbi:hypothetical protein PR202_ga21662 [Eleusine coracana subsp. coracana]|uniref:Uncharacterized protein n=1 Tax=Eleusine coracana subsp. coracana TaxID=191504 RepID=A0AAV5D1L7_ELECO|nr:hypothetical protein PR202_ga21662 [Eleusine coracana subsp. coracana]